MRQMALTPRDRVALGLVVSLLTSAAATGLPAWADDYLLTRATLKGIAAVEVLVEEIDPDAEKDGLTRDQLRTDAAQRLRSAGIPVTPSAQGQLYVNVNTYKGDAGLYAFAIVVEFKQGVRLVRDSTIVTYAPTWSVGSVGAVGADSLRRIVRANMANHVDEFIAAFVEQNPKPAETHPDPPSGRP